MSTIFTLQIMSTAFMTGVIWFVQLVHYPSFRWVDRKRFPSFLEHHKFTTSLVVGPAMLCEAGTAVALFFSKLDPIWLCANAGSLVAVWLFTYLRCMPKHNKLCSGYDEQTVESLVSINWPRTLLWSARSLLWIFIARNNLWAP